ncbi:hypothetical protein [Nitrosopumilus sp.]|uniref:hypothetical protein n=1 Tax=Nitrosopumilus sp. TaxID=2024843 RepID=UPI0034A02A65
MTKTQNSFKILKLANVLRKLGKMKVKGYESTIAMPPDDNFTRLLRRMREVQQEENKILEKLIELITSEYKTKCRHPKKMHDADPNGIVYCMQCGEDV